MKTVLPAITTLILTIVVPAPVAWAQPSDSPGSEDHPMVSRYEGSSIDGEEIRDWDEFELPLGPAVWSEDRVRVPKNKLDIEGKNTRILYRGPKDKSSLDILRNYRLALEGAGFEILFTCGSDCGNNFQNLLYGPTEMRIRKTKTSGSAFDLPQDVRYLAAKLEKGSQTVYISLLTAFDNGFGPLSKQPVTLLQVIESKAMDAGKVTVDAEAIGKGIDATGHMAIYGVLFDTDSATIKPESASILSEIAKLLDARPSLNLLVVGHTDNQGAFDYNMNLSAKRANSVVRYLEQQAGIGTGRLDSAGVGYLAPVATNDSPDGRAMNRRVELVKGK